MTWSAFLHFFLWNDTKDHNCALFCSCRDRINRNYDRQNLFHNTEWKQLRQPGKPQRPVWYKSVASLLQWFLVLGSLWSLTKWVNEYILLQFYFLSNVCLLYIKTLLNFCKFPFCTCRLLLWCCRQKVLWSSWMNVTPYSPTTCPVNFHLEIFNWEEGGKLFLLIATWQ